MALVSKAKAAKLAGVSRTTIHRYAKEGKLSMSGDKVDTSELLRVFGSINESPSEHPATPVQVNTNGQRVTEDVQGVLQYKVTFLEAQIDDIRKERDSWRSKADQLTDLLKAEQENTRLLTHQAPQKVDEKLGWALVALFAVFMAGLMIWQLR